MSILLFFLVLFVLILVHEWGHFIVAKKTGMKVDEFGIGFPPKLFGIQKGETEYTFNALPIGGFVRILGENGSNDDTLSEQDKLRTFSAQPKWAQALVLIAGVTMNVLFAWFLFSLTYMIGVPTAVDEVTASEDAQLYVAAVVPDSPAAVLAPGMVIVEVANDTQTIARPLATEFSEFVRSTAPAPVNVTYIDGDSTQTVSLTPQQNIVADDPDRYAVGVSLAVVEIMQQPIHTALYNGLKTTGAGLVGIFTGLTALIQQSITGEADFSQVAGPVGIVGMVGDAAAFGITALLTFTAIISLNLAVINLLPFPALDGGRLVFVAIEAITRRPIPPAWSGRMNLIGFALLMVLMVAVTYNDIINLL